ncbi:caspase family protein [Bradyrhizobium sp. LTSP849]|uniref:caspase family protein n=1 Tax=Bradyrhizobium sp. LTSP849 TaxID=1615890 RepID=UPI0009E65D04|nr:caspase family protein [Bradyrhizobium sp. LTSP849]
MRRALCVGVDEYEFGALRGCVNDAKRLSTLLSRHADTSRNFDCRTIVAPIGDKNVVTRPVLRDQLHQLFDEPADVALLHFSGHGTINNLDGYLVTQDAATYDEGVAMSDVLKLANDSKAKEIVVLLDCCFSGRLGNPPIVDNTKAILREGISILTAGRGNQPSVETSGGGVFTSLVIDALEGGAANLLGQVSAPAIYAFVEAALGAWDQRPLFKAHLSNVLELRRSTPPIPRTILQNLPSIFPLPAEDHALDPSFESTSPIAIPANVDRFNDLQALYRVHLVAPVGAIHMYNAAMESKACRLTATGRYYWRLANDGRI